MYRLEQVLLPQVKTGECERKILVLNGLGGIGKTQLAVQFARKHQETFTAIFWIDGSSETNLKRSIADSAVRLPAEQVTQASKEYSSGANDRPDEVVRNFLNWLCHVENRHWLMILDNVDRDYQQQNPDIDAYDIEKYIPDADHGSILITTRLARLQQLGDPLLLESVNLSQSRAIFEKWYNRTIGKGLFPLLASIGCMKTMFTRMCRSKRQ
jgi:hypothetical protein